MADDLVVKFSADIAELQQGVAKVNQLLTTGVSKGLQEAGKSGKSSGLAIFSQYDVVARKLNEVGQLVGGATAKFTDFGNKAARAVDGAVFSIATLGAKLTAIAGFIAGAAAIVASFFDTGSTQLDIFTRKFAVGFLSVFEFVLEKIATLTRSFSDSIADAIQAQADLTGDAIKVYKVEIKALEEVASAVALEKKNREESEAAIRKYKDAVKTAAAENKLFKNETKGVEEQLAALNQVLIVAAKQGTAEFEKAFQQFGTQLDSLRNRLKQLKGPAQIKTPIGDLISEDAVQNYFTREAEIRKSFASFVNDLKISSGDFLNVTQETIGQFAAGIGQAVGGALFFAEDFATALENLLKQIGASIVGFLVQLAVEQLIFLAASAIFSSSLAAVEIGAQAGIASAYVAADAFKKAGLLGFAIAPAAAAAAALVVAGAGAAGIGVGRAAAAGASAIPAAEGAIVTGPQLMLVGERKIGDPTEYILNQGQMDRMLGGGLQNITVYLDSKPILRKMVRGFPEELALYGLT